MTDPFLFDADLQQVPASLDQLADLAAQGALHWPVTSPAGRWQLFGMGSSRFAAGVCAARLRARGVNAVADLASTTLLWPAADDLTSIAISASGDSVETLDAVARCSGAGRRLALTNSDSSRLVTACDESVLMHAGVEAGGVACRSFRATIGVLLALEAQWFDLDVVGILRRAAEASAHLLDTSTDWLPPVIDQLSAPDGVWLLAPAERVSSAQQGALMIREGPRRRAAASETGDWSHVDVYLAKPLDYRALMFVGSHYESQANAWLTAREATTVAVGGDFAGAALTVRYPHDDDPLVALLTEVLVPELMAATWWLADPHA